MSIRWPLGGRCGRWSMCPFCLDTHGHYAVTCMHGGDVVIHHNNLRDEEYDLCHCVHLSVSVETCHGLTRDLDHTRPADILISGWDKGKPLALPSHLGESCHQASTAAQAPQVTQMPEVLLSIGSWQLGQGGP